MKRIQELYVFRMRLFAFFTIMFAVLTIFDGGIISSISIVGSVSCVVVSFIYMRKFERTSDARMAIREEVYETRHEWRMERWRRYVMRMQEQS